MKYSTEFEARARVRVAHIEEFSAIANVCGGTVASRYLRECLALRSATKSAVLKRKLDALVFTWRKALELHNGQGRKLVAYSLVTGEPIKERKRK